MSPVMRLAGGLLVLAVYAWVLAASNASVSREPETNAARWLAASNEAFNAGRYADALEPASRLVDRFPNQHLYIERLARIFEKTNRPLDEAAAWERFIELSPTPIDACPEIGKAYDRAGESAKAVAAFERCVSFDQANVESQFFLGLAYYRSGRTADAQRVVDRVIEHASSDADVLLLAGLTAERRGRTREAKRFLERAAAIADDYVDVHIALGRIEAGAGNRAAARRHFERAKELDPSRRREIAVWLDRTAGER